MSIKLDNVFYTYSPKTPFASEALKGVSLEIKKGSFVALIGKTGSGKSTIVQHLNGLLIPSKGEVSIDEFIVKPKKNKNLKNLRKHVGLVFQFPEYQLFEETVEKDVAFGPRNFGINEEESIKLAHEALLKVGLDESFFSRSPFELSGGEKRRVAIAGILALNPEILVLDEPTAGLDPRGTEAIMSLVVNMHKEGKTIILVTHDMDLVLNYCDDCYVIKNGTISAHDEPRKLFANPSLCDEVDIPSLYQLIALLNKEGKNIDTSKIKDIDDLVKELKK